jgi:hypothetical protein
MLIMFLKLIEIFVRISLADTCEEKFKPIDNLCYSINKTSIQDQSDLNCRLPDLQNVDLQSISVEPHAHKRRNGGKYHGATFESLKNEAKEKTKDFNNFFKINYPKIEGEEIDLKFWSYFKLDSPESFNSILIPIKNLKKKGYPLNGFIFIVLEDETIRIAPRSILSHNDTGETKHIALAKAANLKAAGELTIAFDENKAKKIQFNLSSGTYMASLDSMKQYFVCETLVDLIQKVSGIPTEFAEELE